MDKKFDITTQYLKHFVEKLRPQDTEVLKQLNYDFTWQNNIAILYDIRPKWNNREETINSEFAKIRYIKSTKEWKLYWMRASGKWELYEPFPVSSNIQHLLQIIREDAYSCFFG